MTNAYLRERYFEDEEAARDAGWPRWVDVHSVTCLLCGGLAGERESVNVTLDEMIHPDPVIREEMEPIVEEHGEGEAHEGCYEAEVHG